MTTENTVTELFKQGAHYGSLRSRRHPSTKHSVFGTKDGVEIIDLEKTQKALEETLSYIRTLAKGRKKILFVGGKNEAQKAVKEQAEKIDAIRCRSLDWWDNYKS